MSWLWAIKGGTCVRPTILRGRGRNGQLRESAIVPCIGVNPLSPAPAFKELTHPSIHSFYCPEAGSCRHSLKSSSIRRYLFLSSPASAARNSGTFQLGSPLRKIRRMSRFGMASRDEEGL